jgi:hypothetical protein
LFYKGIGSDLAAPLSGSPRQAPSYGLGTD